MINADAKAAFDRVDSKYNELASQRQFVPVRPCHMISQLICYTEHHILTAYGKSSAT